MIVYGVFDKSGFQLIGQVEEEGVLEIKVRDIVQDYINICQDMGKVIGEVCKQNGSIRFEF